MKIIMRKSTAKTIRFIAAIITGISEGTLIATLVIGFGLHPEAFMYVYGEHKTFQEVAPAIPWLVLLFMATTGISFAIYEFFDQKIKEYNKK